MEVTEDWGDVFPGAGASEEASSRVLYVLKFVEDSGGGTIEQAVAVVKSGCDESVDEGFSGSEREFGPEAGNVTEVEECSFCCVIYVGHEREGGVNDNTQVTDLG